MVFMEMAHNVCVIVLYINAISVFLKAIIWTKDD